MSGKRLECIRPNGEKLIIPAVDRAEISLSFRQTSSRGCWTIKEVDGVTRLVDHEEEERENVTAHVITDEMPAMRCMACCGYHTSKSKTRQCYKEHKMIEVGNESLEIIPDPSDERAYDKQLEDDISWAMNAVKYDEAPLDELTKERCKIMNKQIEDSADNRLRDHSGNLLEGIE